MKRMCYLRPRDSQQANVMGHCELCGGELYEEEAAYYDDSIAFGNAKVVESAVVKEKSIVSGETVMGGKSMVTGGAWVPVGHILTGNDWIKGNAINSLALCNKLYDLAGSI